MLLKWDLQVLTFQAFSLHGVGFPNVRDMNSTTVCGNSLVRLCLSINVIKESTPYMRYHCARISRWSRRYTNWQKIGASAIHIKIYQMLYYKILYKNTQQIRIKQSSMILVYFISNQCGNPGLTFCNCLCVCMWIYYTHKEYLQHTWHGCPSPHSPPSPQRSIWWADYDPGYWPTSLEVAVLRRNGYSVHLCIYHLQEKYNLV